MSVGLEATTLPRAGKQRFVASSDMPGVGCRTPRGHLRSSLVRGPVVVASLAILATAVLLPMAGLHLGNLKSFVPMLLVTIICFDVMSVFLLIGDYLDTGDIRILAMTWAYSWSLILMLGYALAFPGVVAAHGPLATTPSVAPWFYLGWHAGFPILLGAAWAPWPSRVRRITTEKARVGLCWRSTLIVVSIAGAAVALVAGFAHHLPTLIVGLDTSRMTELTAPFTLPLVVMALLAAWRGLGHRQGPERWTSTAILFCFCDLVLTYTSRFRFSLGWYTGRTLTMIGSGLVLMAMLGSFRKVKALAITHAATDQLTGLANRRALQAELQRELARSERAGISTTLLSLDLDGFKAINDSRGHAAGDKLLVEVAAKWLAVLRASDLLARVGGDEFVALLPDISPDEAQLVVDRLVRSTPQDVGVSIGLCHVRHGESLDELLSRADKAMYEVKQRTRQPVR
jgi:diguanylate cyclase (GGDEF)-like protein